MEDNVFPNLPNGSVLVLDNASYHRRKITKSINKSSRKIDIMEYLDDHSIEYDPGMTKPKLIDIYNKNQSINQTQPLTFIQQLAEKYDCQVLYLPAYHCELNPIELIWAQIKKNVATKNTVYTLKHVEELTRAAISTVTSENWQNAIRHVIKLEENYSKSIPAEVEITDPVVISFDSDSSDEDGSEASDVSEELF